MSQSDYFNFAPHFWIIYTYIVNGLFVSQALCLQSKQYWLLVETFEARLLSGFFISLLLNGLSLLVLSMLGADFDLMRFILPFYTAVFLCWLALLTLRRKDKWGRFIPGSGWLRGTLYISVFIVLLYNGGLIEQISDAWWHLSLANKIGYLSSFDVSSHLLGEARRYYPPLWHGNLAVVHLISGISLPVIWNSFTAWGAAFKVMGFYLFALGLSRNNAIAFLGSLLFVLLPGLGDSYLRVSAWPSHISYIGWFCLFYVTFRFFDKSNEIADPGVFGRFLGTLKRNFVSALCIAGLAGVLFFSHLAELFWYACALFFYAMGLTAYGLFAGEKGRHLEPADPVLRFYLFCGLVGILLVTYRTYFPLQGAPAGMPPAVIIVSLIAAIALSFLYFLTADSYSSFIFNERAGKVLFFLVLGLILFSIDFRHFFSLFRPELGYPLPGFHADPVQAEGSITGQMLNLPNWRMQLRQGLLYSGIIGVALSLILVWLEQKRHTIFLAANAIIAFLFLVSPYLYQWLSDCLQYHSPWRIGLLIFHPIIFSASIYYLWEIIMQYKRIQ